MDHSARQQQILDYLVHHHFASIDDIAQNIYVSGATVRRDLQKLEDKGFVRMVYGGVVLSEYSTGVVPVSLRDKENSAAKEYIAEQAAKLINDNDTVIFDSSSTVRRICRHIKSRKNLTVITNNLRVCQELKDTDVSVYCTGGALMKRRDCFLSHYAEEFLKQITATSLFFSSQGLLENGDIVGSSEEEIALRKIMLSRVKNKIFLYDSSKLGKEHPFKLCNISEVTHVISDDKKV
jgi:DeoR/GlpR family transcriptional regulator of sugar metabolism